MTINHKSSRPVAGTHLGAGAGPELSELLARGGEDGAGEERTGNQVEQGGLTHLRQQHDRKRHHETHGVRWSTKQHG